MSEEEIEHGGELNKGEYRKIEIENEEIKIQLNELKRHINTARENQWEMAKLLA